MPARYDEKRDFDRTPEPRSTEFADGRYHRRFVIHRHQATRLHYDLRIYNGTALSSWAVPKGFSYRPKDKHLAVQTEDHPLKYLEFEGVIPRGEYGGGTIRVWDSGSFALARGEDVVAEIETGELKVIFHGQRVRGEWHLVNTRGSEWILFKAKDAYARDTAHLLSPSVDLSRLQNTATPPTFMRPARTVGPFDGPDWIFELDFPGVPVRVTTGDSPRIRTPQRKDLTARLSHLWDALGRFACNSALLDGVLVRDGPDGIPDSDAASRAINEEDPAVSLYIYDVTVWDGFDTTSMPLIERKEVVRSIVPAAPSVLFVDYIASRGTELASEAARRGLKRLIAKRADSLYRAGRVSDWRRVDCSSASTSGAINRHVRFSNKTKIYWPGTEITKGDLIAHYEAIAGYLIPHLEGRPVHMHRFPGGIDGKHFYQRHAPAHLPDWIDTVVIGSGDDSEHFVMCNNRESLLYIINLGSIDLHPWMARADSPDAPNWSIIDIDAKQSDFKTAVKAAREVGKVLSGISMVSCVKTSGGDGIHIGIPLKPSYSFAQSRMLAETICRVVAMQNSKSTTVERNPSKRGRRVYLDYLQNAKGQTVVAPYVVRPRPGAPVSMPILWDELDSESSPTDFNVRNAAERVAQTGDLFRSVLDKPQSIDAPIENLESYLGSMKK